MNLFGLDIRLAGKENGKYPSKELCDERHKNIEKELKCIPEIKATVIRIDQKIKDFLDGNGKGD